MDPRMDLVESARCRAALGRLPLGSLIIVDASHVDTRLDTVRKYGRAPKGSRAYARQFMTGDGMLRTVMGVMTSRGMHPTATAFLVSALVAFAGHLALPLLLQNVPSHPRGCALLLVSLSL